MKTKLFTLFLALIASVGTIFAESGTCGEHLTWNLSYGVLTISGTGPMTNYVNDYRYRAPWFDLGSAIQTIIIGDEVTTIGNWAFMSCENLTSVRFGNNLTRIGYQSFESCTSLTSVTIPNNVTSIEAYAFCGCSSLTSVTIPASVTSIGVMAFLECTSLTSVTNYSIRPQSIQSTVFSFVDLPSATLYVPAQGIEDYKAVDPWKNFGTIKTIESQIETVETNANIIYVGQENTELHSEPITLHVPVAPEIEGFTFLRWDVIAGTLSEGIHLQAIYTADDPSAIPDEVYSNPSNPAQKLVRNGNVYILRGEHVYDTQGKMVR